MNKTIKKLKKGKLCILFDASNNEHKQKITKIMDEAFPDDNYDKEIFFERNSGEHVLISQKSNRKLWFCGKVNKDTDCKVYMGMNVIPVTKLIPKNEILDDVVKFSVDHLVSRSNIGIKKYNTTLHENNGDNYLKHLHDELGDAVNYVSKIRMKVEDETVSDEELGAWIRNLTSNNIKTI